MVETQSNVDMRRIDAVIRRFNVVQYFAGILSISDRISADLAGTACYAETSISQVIAAELVTTS